MLGRAIMVVLEPCFPSFELVTHLRLGVDRHSHITCFRPTGDAFAFSDLLFAALREVDLYPNYGCVNHDATKTMIMGPIAGAARV